MLKIPDLTLTDEFGDAASDPFLLQVSDLTRPDQGSEESRGPGWDLRVARRANAATNLVKEAVFDKVVAQLGEHGVEVIAPYKGIYLLLTLYRECPWIRPMADVDFIVRRADFAKVREALKEVGSVHPTNPGRPLWSAIFHEFSAQVSGVSFDVHRGFTPLRVFGLDTDRMLEEAVVLSNAAGKGSKILVLGLAYKRDIDDTRESPSFPIMEDLLAAGAHVSFQDPFFVAMPDKREFDLDVRSVELNE